LEDWIAPGKVYQLWKQSGADELAGSIICELRSGRLNSKLPGKETGDRGFLEEAALIG